MKAIKKSKLNENKKNKKDFDLIIEKCNYRDYDNIERNDTEYYLYPRGYQNEAETHSSDWEYDEPEITIKEGKKNFQMIGGMMVWIAKGYLCLNISSVNGTKRGLEKYKLEKHLDISDYYKVDEINKESLKALKDYCAEVDYQRNKLEA